MARTTCGATSTVTGLTEGESYHLFALWTAAPGQATNATFRFADDAGSLGDDVVVDQTTNDPVFTENGQRWVHLGRVTLTDGDLQVILDTTGADGTVVIDGIRVVSPAEYTLYDANGNVAKRVNGEGEATRYTYDAWDRLLTETDPNGGVTTYAYDFAGNLVSLTDPVGNVHGYTYDRLGRQTGESVVVDNVTLTRTYTYNVAGDLIHSVDRDGRVTTYEYDVFGRVVAQNWYATESDRLANLSVNRLETSYDVVGRVTSVADTQGADANSYSYGYDTLDRVTTTTFTTAGTTVTLTDGYDRGDGLRTSNSATIGTTADYLNTYTYNDLGRQTSVHQTGQSGGNGVQDKLAVYNYDLDGRLTGIERKQNGHGVALTVYEYDATGRLKELEHTAGTTLLNKYEYQYDGADRITKLTSHLDGVAVYGYDSRGQLTSAVHGNSPSGIAVPDFSTSYDASGNQTDTGYSTGDQNRLTTDGASNYEYDAEGNRSRKTTIATGDYVTYTWDHANRLTQVSFFDSQNNLTQRVTYQYDVFGRRMAERIDEDGDSTLDRGEIFIHDSVSKNDGMGNPVTDVVLVLTESYSVAGVRLNTSGSDRQLHGIAVDQILAEEKINNSGASFETKWTLADHLGTVKDRVSYDAVNDETVHNTHVIFDEFGDIIAEFDHVNMTWLTDSDAQSLRNSAGPSYAFTGREYDAASGLYHYRARWYDAKTHQFLSEDPAFDDKANTYRYAGNDPVNRKDPSGLAWPTLQGIAIDIASKPQDYPIANRLLRNVEFFERSAKQASSLAKASPVLAPLAIRHGYAPARDKWFGVEQEYRNELSLLKARIAQWQVEVAQRPNDGFFDRVEVFDEGIDASGAAMLTDWASALVDFGIYFEDNAWNLADMAHAHAYNHDVGRKEYRSSLGRMVESLQGQSRPNETTGQVVSNWLSDGGTIGWGFLQFASTYSYWESLVGYYQDPSFDNQSRMQSAAMAFLPMLGLDGVGRLPAGLSETPLRASTAAAERSGLPATLEGRGGFGESTLSSNGLGPLAEKLTRVQARRTYEAQRAPLLERDDIVRTLPGALRPGCVARLYGTFDPIMGQSFKSRGSVPHHPVMEGVLRGLPADADIPGAFGRCAEIDCLNNFLRQNRIQLSLRRKQS